MISVKIFKNKKAADAYAAGLISIEIRRKSGLVLGLATGNTMIPLYNEIVKKPVENKLDFSNIKTFNLDEYVGLNPGDKGSLRHFMERHFFSKVNLKRENIRFL